MSANRGALQTSIEGQSSGAANNAYAGCMGAIVEQYLASVSAALQLVDGTEVSTRWVLPSILPEYTVGALTAHLGRSITNVETYLERPAPVDAAPMDAPTYFATVLADADPVDSDLHRAVRSRSVEVAAAGHSAVVANLRGSAERLHSIDLAAQPPILVLDGIAMSIDEYLRTRIVELAVHAADLAASVGVEAPALPPDVWEQVARTVGETAVRRHGAEAYALSIARPDRTGRLAAF